MLEILAPAGSPESVVAAVQNGADAVYMGFGGFNARQNAKNFTSDTFAEAAEYCRVRGVKTYVTLNTLTTDREFDSAVEHARLASSLGADGIIVQDLGLMQAIRQVAPDLRLTASTQMTVHSLAGVQMAAAMGADRVVLARELSAGQIRQICEKSPIEIEVFAHGALCMCYSGQCEMSAVIGRRSGNRGWCAQPCRLPYAAVRSSNKYPLSLKDNCMIRHLRELEQMGVASLKIEGRMRRPEYAAIVTGIYSRAVKEGVAPTEEDMRALTIAFSRQGFTDGYYTGKKGREMFGVRQDDQQQSQQAQVIFATARKNYLNGEFQRVPVWFVGRIREGEPAWLAVKDDRDNKTAVTGMTPELAFSRSVTSVTLQTQLMKTGGTPFYCAGVKSQVQPGLSLPAASINDMRRRALSEIFEMRRALPERRQGDYTRIEHLPNDDQAPALTVSVRKLSQLSAEMVHCAPEVLYVPMEEMGADPKIIKQFRDVGTEVCVIIPRIMQDHELPQARQLLELAKRAGIETALVGNIGQIPFARAMGFGVRGDFGLNVFNSYSLQVLRDLKLLSGTLSFELRLEQIRDLSKCLDTEILVYGRLPLMITENCVIKNDLGTCGCDSFPGLKDRTGAQFPVLKEFGCRSGIYNAKKLYMADRLHHLEHLGLWAGRVCFTTENADECLKILRAYAGMGNYAPASFTRGLYYRGVE